MRLTLFASRHRAPLLILLALALAYWGKVLFTGQVLLPGAFLSGFAPFGGQAQAPWTILQWDALGQYYPWRAFAARELHAGQLPLWNPHQFCGAPLLANGQSAIFYPLNLPFWIFDTALAFGISAFLHTLLAAFGTYFLAQRWGLSRAASLLSAIAFAFCGYLAAWAMLPTLANTAAWLPLLMRSAECGVRNERVSDGKHQELCAPSQANHSAFRIPHSALLTCALLAGHAQVFFYLLLALFIHALFLPQRGRALLQLNLAGALAGLLGAIQLLPTLELAKLGHRAVGGGPSAAGWQGIADRALSRSELPSLALPGWPMNWGSLNESFGYVGLGVCLLALGALVLWKQPGVVARNGTPRDGGDEGELGKSCASVSPCLRVSVALAFFGLLYALATPLPQLFYWTVPGLSQMGGVGRALLLWSLGAALLAGLGLDALRRKIASPALPAIALIFVTGELFAYGWNLHPIAPRASIYPATIVTNFLQRNLHKGERVWLITPRGGWLPSELLQRAQRMHPPGVLPPNGAMVYGLNDINGYDSLAPRAYREWLAQFTTKLSPELNGNMILLDDLPSQALDAMNVRFIVTQEPRAVPGEIEIMRVADCLVYRRNVGAARRVNGSDFYPGWKDGAYQPETFRFGAFVSLLAVSFQLSAFSFRRSMFSKRRINSSLAAKS